MTLNEKAEKIWEAYPRSVGRKLGLQKIKSCLKHYDYEMLLNKTTEFSKFVLRRKIDAMYIPHASTYYNQERFMDAPEAWYPQDSRRTVRTTL